MTVKIENNGPVYTVIMDQPEIRNAVNRKMADALYEAFHNFEQDDEAKVAVLYGSGGNFCAGANLKSMQDGTHPRVEKDGPGPLGCTRMLLSKPVIGAISGYAVAGGLELALWCDLRVVEESAVFGVFCRRFGVPLIDGGTIRLPRLIGMSRAMDMVLTGRPVEAKEAYLFGLANRLVDEGNARDEAEKLALEISKFPETCMRNDRLSSYEQFGMGLDDALKNEFDRGYQTLESGEFLSGSSDFTKGRGKHGKF